MAELREIIDRLEKLTGYSREVDAAIYNALVDDGGRRAFKVKDWSTEPGSRLDRFHDGWLVGKSETDRYAEALPRYSASLDAIVALIKIKQTYARVDHLQEIDAVHWTAALRFAGGVSPYRQWGSGSTPAIALCICLLKAMEAGQ